MTETERPSYWVYLYDRKFYRIDTMCNFYDIRSSKESHTFAFFLLHICSFIFYFVRLSKPWNIIPNGFSPVWQSKAAKSQKYNAMQQKHKGDPRRPNNAAHCEDRVWVILGSFHQCFTSRFCTWRFQKRKKDIGDLTVFLRSCDFFAQKLCLNYCHLATILPTIFRAAFLRIFMCQKTTKPNCY